MFRFILEFDARTVFLFMAREAPTFDECRTECGKASDVLCVQNKQILNEVCYCKMCERILVSEAVPKRYHEVFRFAALHFAGLHNATRRVPLLKKK